MTVNLPPAQLSGTAETARHPLDPDPVRSTKANAVLALGIVALITGPVLGGLVPALLALVLARQATTEMAVAQGFLTGRRRLRAGVRLAWAGVVLALAVLVIAAMRGLLGLAAGGSGDFGPNVD